MAREVTTLVGTFEYVLDIENNREDPSPMWVLMEPLSAKEMQAYERATSQQGGRGQNLVHRVQLLIEEIIARRVHEVHNYTLKGKSGKLHTPCNGLELVEALKDGPPREQDLIQDELLESLKSHSKVEAGMRKKLQPQSD